MIVGEIVIGGERKFVDNKRLPGTLAKILAISLLLMIAPVPVLFAQGDTGASLGYRLGFPLERTNGDSGQIELYGKKIIPWKMVLCGNWTTTAAIDMSIACQCGEGDHGGKVSLATELLISPPRRNYYLTFSLGGGMLFQEEIGSIDFGGPLFFLSRIGFIYRLTADAGIGCVYQHESNGDIYGVNPSLNLCMFEVRISF